MLRIEEVDPKTRLHHGTVYRGPLIPTEMTNRSCSCEQLQSCGPATSRSSRVPRNLCRGATLLGVRPQEFKVDVLAGGLFVAR